MEYFNHPSGKLLGDHFLGDNTSVDNFATRHLLEMYFSQLNVL